MRGPDLRSLSAAWAWIIFGRCCCRRLYRLMRCLLGLATALLRRDLSKDAELLILRHENIVLRRQTSRVLCRAKTCNKRNDLVFRSHC